MCSRGWILQSLLALGQPLSRLARGLGYCHMLAGEGGVISPNRNPPQSAVQLVRVSVREADLQTRRPCEILLSRIFFHSIFDSSFVFMENHVMQTVKVLVFNHLSFT